MGASSSSQPEFSRRARVTDAGRQYQGRQQRLEVLIGLAGAFLLFSLLLLIVAAVQGAMGALVTAAVLCVISFVVAASAGYLHRSQHPPQKPPKMG